MDHSPLLHSRLAFAMLLILTALPHAPAIADSPRTGEFETTFTNRSPLSQKKDLLARLAHKSVPDDYDLSKEPFLLYVPSNYDPAQACGIIVWINFNDANKTPQKWHPLLDQSRLIFIVSKSAQQDDWIRAGLALDAVHNLKNLYNIDPNRIYLFAMPPPEHTIGQKMGLAWPDVFTGFVYIFNQRYFRPIPVPGQPGLSYAVSFSRSTPDLFAQAKIRRHVMIVDRGTSNITKVIHTAYQQDGFRQILFVEAGRDEVDYPDLQTSWLQKTLEFLDGPTESPSTAPATQPARPTVSEAQSLLNLARAYIGMSNYSAARVKLNDLIARYPADPCATQARELLEQIKDK